MATLEQIIDEARTLSPAEKRQLRGVLDRELEEPKRELHLKRALSCDGDDEVRQRRMEWLKSHREEYGGQYVVLDGDHLLAVGPNYRVAREKAVAAGKPNAFITYLPQANEVLEMGGWL